MTGVRTMKPPPWIQTTTGERALALALGFHMFA
jgi:hypothetical protein